MKIDCQWFNAHREAFACDMLNPDDRRQARQHLESCAVCSRDIASDLETAARDAAPPDEMDSLVRSVYRNRLAVARTSAPSRAGLPARRRTRWMLPAAAAALTALLLLVVLSNPADEAGVDTPVNELATAGSEISSADKQNDLPEDSRGKPDEQIPATDAPAAARGFGTPAQTGGLDFAVIDAAGYTSTLDDYRGQILLAGLWDGGDAQTARNIDTLYRMFGTVAGVRVLGILPPGATRLAGTSFPEAFNSGSHLFGAAEGEFVLVDATGVVRLHGSLSGDSDELVEMIRTTLDELEIQ